jgi:hypothetical protein
MSPIFAGFNFFFNFSNLDNDDDILWTAVHGRQKPILQRIWRNCVYGTGEPDPGIFSLRTSGDEHFDQQQQILIELVL